MPLFGKSHKHDNDNVNTVGSNDPNDPLYNQTGTGGVTGHHTHGTHGTHGTGVTGTHNTTAGTGYTDPNYANQQSLAGGGLGSGGNVGMPVGGMGASGMGTTGMGAGGIGTASGIPPAGNINSSTHTGGGGGTAMTGKIEKAVGSLVGSESLKMKGLEKEQEAAALKAQSLEIQEAERLEAEARVRRERAVGHGTHPDHKHPGGHASHI